MTKDPLNPYKPPSSAAASGSLSFDDEDPQQLVPAEAVAVAPMRGRGYFWTLIPHTVMDVWVWVALQMFTVPKPVEIGIYITAAILLVTHVVGLAGRQQKAP